MVVELEEPDKGYAWVVAFCACLINTILSGMARMIGLLYVAIIASYGVSREEASLPFTVRNAVRYFAGPLTGVLGQTYGIRNITFWGGVVAAAGSVLCAFAPTVEWIVFFWGGIHGVGFALSNTLFQVTINQYFEKHRASASGLVLSGACFGSLLFPFALESILGEFGLCGCFLLLGGLFLNVLPPSILLKAPPWVDFPEVYARQRSLLLNRKEPKKHESKNGFDKNSPSVICTLYKDVDADHLEWKSNFQIRHGIDSADGRKGKTQKGLLENMRCIPRLYLNPVYCLISLSLATYFWVFLPVLTAIIDYTRDKGIPDHHHNFLIHSLTVGDLLGRIGFGWVTDRHVISLTSFMALSFVLQGAFVAIFPLCITLGPYIAVVCLYGVTAGIIFVHFPVLVHRYVEEENQSIAIGCVGLASSLATFALPSLIGYFRDEVGSYDGLFYMLGMCSVVNGSLWLLVPLWKKNTNEGLISVTGFFNTVCNGEVPTTDKK